MMTSPACTGFSDMASTTALSWSSSSAAEEQQCSLLRCSMTMQASSLRLQKRCSM